jgi:hypothetical protein
MLQREMRKCIARGAAFYLRPPGGKRWIGLDWIASSGDLVLPFLSSVNGRSKWQVTICAQREGALPPGSPEVGTLFTSAAPLCIPLPRPRHAQKRGRGPLEGV